MRFFMLVFSLLACAACSKAQYDVADVFDDEVADVPGDVTPTDAAVDVAHDVTLADDPTEVAP